MFGGNSDRPWRESDTTGPLNTYGESKLAGEWAVESSDCRKVILRTSWVYSGHGNNFVLTMLRLAGQSPALSIVSDQTGCPTWARNLAGVSRTVIGRILADANNSSLQGLYHYCDSGAVTWYQFAHAIFSTAVDLGLLPQEPELTAVPSSGFPQKAERPLYSVLDTSAIRTAFGIEPNGLEESLRSCLEELLDNE